MHSSYYLILLLAFFHAAAFALPQVRAIETTFTTMITAREESTVTRDTSIATSKPLNQRRNDLESEISTIKSAISEDCVQVTAFQRNKVFSCASDIAGSLLENFGLISDATSTTVELSTVTVSPIPATTGARRREVLTLGDQVFTVSDLASSLNLGAIQLSATPTPSFIVFKPLPVLAEPADQPIQATDDGIPTSTIEVTRTQTFNVVNTVQITVTPTVTSTAIDVSTATLTINPN
ncbi:hypothetical protein OCU04_012894 [Sclerotinia nivalis]|uniref:Cell wall protein n=1 Tax=Sclerotinia nivalis TaxID=352851 RepID=A0A9X0ADC1_9HELO|nr:hypothetical protein OCU04_012894 [Sclerotinia nivalis]